MHWCSSRQAEHVDNTPPGFQLIRRSANARSFDEFPCWVKSFQNAMNQIAGILSAETEAIERIFAGGLSIKVMIAYLGWRSLHRHAARFIVLTRSGIRLFMTADGSLTSDRGVCTLHFAWATFQTVLESLCCYCGSPAPIPRFHTPSMRALASRWALSIYHGRCGGVYAACRHARTQW